MQSLEERKQEFREQLKIDFTPKKANWFQLVGKGTKYQSTQAIIKPYSSNNWRGHELFVKERSLLLLGIFLIVAPLIAFATTYRERNYIQFVVFAVFLCYGFKVIYDPINLKTTLTINQKGIYYHQWAEYINWKDIVITYIQEIREGSTTHTYTSNWLLVFYHDRKTDLFEKKAIPLYDLKTDIEEVSFAIEYLKTKAGFPTQPEHYS